MHGYGAAIRFVGRDIGSINADTHFFRVFAAVVVNRKRGIGIAYHCGMDAHALVLAADSDHARPVELGLAGVKIGSHGNVCHGVGGWRIEKCKRQIS